MGCCEHDNEPSGSIKGEEFLDYVSDYQLLKKDSTPWNWFVTNRVTRVTKNFHGKRETSGAWNMSPGNGFLHRRTEYDQLNVIMTLRLSLLFR
jgi:hypothetical protein